MRGGIEEMQGAGLGGATDPGAQGQRVVAAGVSGGHTGTDEEALLGAQAGDRCRRQVFWYNEQNAIRACPSWPCCLASAKRKRGPNVRYLVEVHPLRPSFGTGHQRGEKMRGTNVLLPFGMCFLLACAGTSATLSAMLQPGAESVRIMKDAPSTGATRAGEVSCDICGNGVPLFNNIESCRNEFRNKAKSMGADLVVIENEIYPMGNCVIMFGTAYKAPTAPPAAETPK